MFNRWYVLCLQPPPLSWKYRPSRPRFLLNFLQDICYFYPWMNVKKDFLGMIDELSKTLVPRKKLYLDLESSIKWFGIWIRTEIQFLIHSMILTNSATFYRCAQYTSRFRTNSPIPYKWIQVINKYMEGTLSVLKEQLIMKIKKNLVWWVLLWDSSMMASTARWRYYLPLHRLYPYKRINTIKDIQWWRRPIMLSDTLIVTALVLLWNIPPTASSGT